MRRRVLLAAVLFVVAGVLLGVSVSRRGLPWEFGPRAAVLLEVSGQAQLRLSTARMEREKLDQRLQALGVGSDVFPGDRIQVGPLGFARLSMRSGVVGFDTHSSGTFRIGLIEIARGRVELELYRPAEVRLAGDDGGPVTQLAAGRYWASAGGGGFAVHVVDGEARRGDLSAQAGQAIFTLASDAKVLSPAEFPAPDTSTLILEDDNVFGTAPPMSQVFINGRSLTYPDAGKFEVKLPAGVTQPTVVVRDLFGRTAQVEPSAPDARRRKTR